ncbi:MAG: winged helix-turn-helix domain-containing protein [Chloroflexi bacterium]|nr:winged helix-turn-helix domain-containing protein [Chloroflexota bacterium]
MRFTVLGELRVISRSDIALSRPAHRRLLSILLLETDRVLDTELLIDRFWSDEPPETARAALQTYVSQLRRLLGDGVIVTSDSGYRLDLRGHHLDSQVFGALASAAGTALSAGAWHEVLNHAERALALWRGPAFAELQLDAFALPEITRLEELRLGLMEMRAEALLAMGRTEEALPDLERAVVEHPLRERLREHLMVARARLGRVSEALSTYHDLRRELGDAGLEPGPRLRELEERILREDPVLVPSRVRNNLPQRLTTFVGRRSELEGLQQALTDSRMVTLTGVGGTGKTRLAIELAQRLMPGYPDGVFMTSFAALSDPDLVATDAAEALGLRVERTSAEETLRESLRNRRVLVVLDNCEHLLAACARLVEVLLQSGPGVSVLATSREALRVPGETTYAVPPLATPPADGSGGRDIGAFDAMRLFADRAALASRGFVLSDRNSGVVAEICRQLDGLPLAIELAAARVRSLAPEEIAARLEDRFRLLKDGGRTSPGRHKTLHAAIDWSYQLLTDDERALFTRLSVFAGGCTLEAAEAICSGDGLDRADVLDLLSRLVDKSLVVLSLTPAGTGRYRLLETIRQFAQGCLGEAEVASVQRRHREWFSSLAHAADAHLDGSDQLALLDRLHDDRDNLQAALERSVRDGDRQQAAGLAEALAWYRVKQGHYRQGVDLMGMALEHLDPAAEPEREAALLVRRAGTRYSMGDQAALADAERARSLLADAAPSAVKVRALTEFATLHLRINQRDAAKSISAAREAIVAARAIGDPLAESHALRELGVALSWAGQVDEGVERLREALVMARETGNPAAILGVYLRLYITLLDFAQRQHEATALADEAIAWLDGGGERWAGSVALLSWFAMGFQRSGDWSRAEETLDRCGRYHQEGAVEMSYLTLRALQDWMRGRLDEAQANLRALRETTPPSRYFRLLFPIEAGIRADEGRLDAVRTTAERHLSSEVGPVEESTKAGTLHALVRAEVDAALDAPASDRADHLRRAQEAIDTMRDLIERYPPATLAGLQLEIAGTYLLLSQAEVTRASDPQPDLWRALLDRPWYAYWRLYSRCRLGESLLAAHQRDEGSQQLRLAWQQASALGAEILRDEIGAVARRAEIGLS